MTGAADDRLGRRHQDQPGAKPSSEPSSEQRIGWPVWRLAGVIVFGAFASGMDASLANIGLKSISSDLGSTLATTQWVTSGYLLALAVSLPLSGWLGRRYGPGRVWLASLVAFTVASGLCAAAPTVAGLIALRFLQGLAGGLLIPAGQTVLGRAVGSARLGRVMATLGIVVAVAPALGPVIGGLILHGGSWRWLFAINLPIGAVGLALGLRYLPRGERGRAPHLDWPGLLLISTGLPALVYALTAWGDRGSLAHPVVVGALAVGVGALAAFVARCLRHREPLLDLRLYRRNQVYRAATVTTGLTGMILFGSGLVFPLYLQVGQGQSVLATGLRLLGLGAATALVMPAAGRLTDRHGGGVVSAIGCATLVAVSVAFALLPLDAGEVVIQIVLALFGAATAFAAVPAGIAAYKTVTPEQLPDATTTVNIVQRVGGALGGALLAVVIARNLPDDPEGAFRHAFWLIALTGLLGLLSALWLHHALRGAEQSGRTGCAPRPGGGSAPVEPGAGVLEDA
ncbi:DHA2 family efflux MFS transporter permease subunit [Frankia sp. Ag45/Mut15]|uniref:DHA2 family efflux MFS transporter permease subunit n=1 Tax=Frankia umida TaxID=573489 RepID=A0ABT0JSK6_9ACTN|nr:DHA2 family efflux MFS transporter permease subunit [Frankia umida]MCK9874547.1 DHA2 family efflux MFS transporter permease subunit [Frankia umida]